MVAFRELNYIGGPFDGAVDKKDVSKHPAECPLRLLHITDVFAHEYRSLLPPEYVAVSDSIDVLHVAVFSRPDRQS